MCISTPYGLAIALVLWSIGDRSICCANAIETQATCKHDRLPASGQGRPRVLLQSSSSKLRVWGATISESPYLVNLDYNTTQIALHRAEDISFASRRARFIASPQGEPLDEIDKVKKSMHTAVAVMLLGFVAFVMALFYLVNFPDEDIKAATWKLLSTTMSIFIALLMFSSTQHFLTFATGTGTSESKSEGELRVAIGHEEVTHDIILFAFARFVFFWLVLQLHLYFVHSRHIAHKPQANSDKSHTLKGVAAIGSHIVAFSGMDAFGTVQEQGFFAGNLYHCIAGVIFVGAVLWVLFDLANIVRSRIVQMRNSNLEAQQEWKEWVSECNAAQHESASLILGLLLSQCIRFGITGTLPPLEGGSPMGRSRAQVHVLFAVAICLGTLVVALQITIRKMFGGGEQSWNKGWTKRCLRVIRETLATTMAWCLTYWGRWAFWMSTGDSGLGYGDKMTALLATSLFMSIFCFAGVLGIDFIADNLVGESGEAGCVALIRSLGLVLGLAWESTFHEALGAIGSVHLFPVNYELNVLILICILVVTTLPAWMIYILPEANRDRGPLCHIRSDDEDDD